MSTTLVMVPVPEDRVLEVYALLARPKGAAESIPAVVSAGPVVEAPSIDDELIARAYRESPPAMKGFLEYLADRPGVWISSREIGDSLGLDWNKVAGVLGAFGRRWHNRYQQPQKRWFFDERWNHDKNHQEYRMPERAAEVIKAERNGS
jgi:hypothetical protein